AVYPFLYLQGDRQLAEDFRQGGRLHEVQGDQAGSECRTSRVGRFARSPAAQAVGNPKPGGRAARQGPEQTIGGAGGGSEGEGAGPDLLVYLDRAPNRTLQRGADGAQRGVLRPQAVRAPTRIPHDTHRRGLRVEG